MVGVSHNAKDFSRLLFRELLVRGYDVIPVNPLCSDVEGIRGYSRLGDIDPPVDGALLMTAPAVTNQIVRECPAAHVTHVWMYGPSGAGPAAPEAIHFCALRRITVVANECPMMYLKDAAWFHRAHGLLRQLCGTYPR